MTAALIALAPFALLGARFSLRRLRSREWKMSDPADNPALDGHRVPQRRCEACGSAEWTDVGGVPACGLCGGTWAMGE